MSYVNQLVENFLSTELELEWLVEARGKDPADVAIELIDSRKDLEREFNQRIKSIKKALDRAAQHQKGAARYGAGDTEAATILKGQPLKEIKALQTFVNNVVKQLESL